MSKRAKEGMLEEIISLAIPTCQQAERLHPRTGPGAKPQIPDWVLAVMILTAVLLHKKSKTDQYYYWCEHPSLFARCFPRQRMPGRSTFFARYARICFLVQTAILLQGRQAIANGWAIPSCVSADKSLIAGRGRRCRSAQLRSKKVPRGVDPGTTWGFSQHDGWVQGYSYEVVVTAPYRGVTWPLLASVDTASRSEQRSLLEKLPDLPSAVKHVMADGGYDSNAVAEAVEWHPVTEAQKRPRRTGRRFLCPQIPRPQVGKRRRPGSRETRERQHHRRLRAERQRYFETPQARSLYARRKVRAEPFNSHFKSLFALEDKVWLWGMGNNRTMLLVAIWAYQLLLTVNFLHQRSNAQLKWILHQL